jgi:FkbM family methyltransferase
LNYSLPVLVELRHVTRRLGLNRLLGGIFARSGYEDRFGPALLSKVKGGDIVWDVGANVGLYSVQFGELVGPQGLVVAFEPVPACFRELQRKCRGMRIARPENVALGSADGELTMVLEKHELAATHRVVESSQQPVDGAHATVVVRSASSFVAEHPELFPNLIKVDVEGFEGAVFNGLKDLLSDRRLWCIGIEVHFGLLEARGERDTPKKLEEGLRAHGFQVHWTDASHLIAVR